LTPPIEECSAHVEQRKPQTTCVPSQPQRL